MPTPSLAIDATLNPDFSQIESDQPQIAANERFALFFPEKRPFFLEGVDLFDTPIDAVYTRSITEPDWGARATGGFGHNSYTVLVADDRGGGSLILPGPNNSSLAAADFTSTVSDRAACATTSATPSSPSWPPTAASRAAPTTASSVPTSAGG